MSGVGATAGETATTALAVLPSRDLAADLAWFTEALGFRLERILPADDPRVAELSGHGLRIRLERSSDASPGTLCLREPAGSGDRPAEPGIVSDSANDLPNDSPADFPGECRSPGGTRVLRERDDEETVVLPPIRHRLEVRRLADGAPWVVGRAGMHYRDLIPSRLGGSIIASHIRIPGGGPVPDSVHYHAVGFQLIHCVRGRVRLVYEDQGEPFWLEAGDSVTQPPRIRHRVLEASDGLEVVEIGVPAEHVTRIDHEMTLPTTALDPMRTFHGQRFCRSRAAEGTWEAHAVSGFERRDTGVASASGGVATVSIVRSARAGGRDATRRVRHEADILFGFVLGGSLALDARELVAGDAFTLPPRDEFRLGPASADLEWLEVALPGDGGLSEG